MDFQLFVLFGIIAYIRIIVLFLSNTAKYYLLQSKVGREHSQQISKLLAILHTIIYFAAFGEGIIRKQAFDQLSMIGLILLLFSYIVLVLVICTMAPLWTVKSFSVEHLPKLEQTKYVLLKQVNYTLNIVLELISVALIFHSVYIIILYFPYAVLLYLRIKKEQSFLLYRT
ncbi:MAG: isoprenylcysteine carboxylmethyltransferase family protein [Enterococcus sp.]